MSQILTPKTELHSLYCLYVYVCMYVYTRLNFIIYHILFLFPVETSLQRRATSNNV